MNLLSDWRAQFGSIDKSPWPGPRPQRERTDEGVDAVSTSFHGRADDAAKVALIIREHKVSVLSGASGVGKTSALYQAVRPELEARGWAVMLCDKWSPPKTFDPGELIAKQVEGQQLPRGVRLGEGRPALVDQLDRYYPDKSVIILDQFEELIRYRKGAYQQVLRWIEKTANSSRVRIVISLRVEYEHELTGPGGLNITPFSEFMGCELAPITDSAVIKDIIDGGRIAGDEPAASEAATAKLIKAWETTHSTTDWSEVGLLHLQATLYSLWHSKKKDESRVEEHHVDKLLEEVESFNAGQSDSDAVGIFEYGLTKCVEVALEHCRRACAPAGVDDTLAARARELVSDMTTHLASGGYKISLDRDELADRVIRANQVASDDRAREQTARGTLADRADDAAAVRLPDELPDELDWLSVRRSVLLDDPDGTTGKWPWDLDPHDSTGGALLGLRPVDSVIEELRSLHFALEWLRMCELVRVTSTEPGKVMVSLNHDRFAAGLARWRQTNKVGSKEAIARVAAIRGAVLDWSDETENADGADELDAVIANVRWADCQITRHFTGTTFVNCDFRGSTFRGSVFNGVSFINCLLDDVEFLDCTILGKPGPLPTGLDDDQIREQPSFVLDAPKLVPILHRYRETVGADSAKLFSRTAGVAAVPAGVKDSARVGCGPQPQPGGLTMYGGFLSSLKVRACKFPDGGTLSLRHVAGTSVELAEQAEANVEVFAAALRGLTVTLPISKLTDSTSSNGPSDGDTFRLKISDSRIINAWFGPGLTGTAEFTNCRVWQVFNASNSFSVTLPNSPLMGAINIQTPDEELVPFNFKRGDESSPEELKDILVGSLDGLELEVLIASRLIDYRRRPAKLEITRQLETGEDQ